MISENEINTEENGEKKDLGTQPSMLAVEERMDWWPELSDLDRLNVLNAPLEDRARILSSKTSSPVEETMNEIGRKTKLNYLDNFDLPENPTKILPLRLIHSFSCLPLEEESEGKVHLVTVWPPTPRMSRWVYAVSGNKPIWSLGSPEKIVRAITENFGIGADSLGDSDLDLDSEGGGQDDLEVEKAAIISIYL